MIASVLGELVFQTGWKTRRKVMFWGREQEITVKARAYTEDEGLTEAQERAFSDFKAREGSLAQTVEALLRAYAPDCDGAKRFSPRTVLFEQDGGYALLCDDRENPDEGVAVVLSPSQVVVSQDEYL